MTRRARVLARAGATAAILAALVLGFTVRPAAAGAQVSSASSGGTWSLQPYNEPGQQHPRVYCAYFLDAGQQIIDHLQLTNLTSHPITFDIYPSDALNVADGGAFSLEVAQDKPQLVGTWIYTPVKTRTVAPGHAVIFSFLVHVPAGTPSGDYAGGLVALDTAAVPRRSGSVVVNVEQAIGVRVYVRVNGPVQSAVVINGLRAVSSPRGSFSWLTGEQGGRIDFQLDDVGNSRLDATAHVWVTGTFGGHVGTFAPVTVDDLLPGSSVDLSVPWPDIPEVGVYHLHVSVSASPGAGGASVTDAAANVDFDLPWVVLLLLMILLVGLSFLVVWRRRRKRRRRVEGVTPAGAAA